METINRTLKYVDLFMYRNLNIIPDYQLPEGYKFVLFKDGDEKDWVNIELSSGEFLSFKEGIENFDKYYGKHYQELKKRCLFVENEAGDKVATATAFYLEKPMGDITGNVHWVSVKKEYQGKRLSKPLICETLKLMRSLGHEKTLLHTQTHTWLAVKVYLYLGFVPYRLEESYEGWQIIKKLTNFGGLQNIRNMDEKEMYDFEFLIIDQFLKSKFEEPFEYKIWDEKNVIGVNFRGKLFQYWYTFENGELKIKELEK